MFVNQEADDNVCEGFINLDNITYISKHEYSDGTVIYKCYLVGDDDPLTINQKTFDKIIAEKGVI